MDKNQIKVYNNFDYSLQGECLENISWSRNDKEYSCFHSISSYLAMFPPSLPKFFINKYTKFGDFVMDNFSGRGTTALVSRELNRNFIGSDLNPYAFVLSKAKITTYTKKSLISFVNELEKKYIKNRNIYSNEIKKKKYEELKYFYSNETLSQLIFLRETIGKKWNNNNNIINATLAFAIGLMHGPTKKDGTSIYFSISMPNTISMAPNYVKKYSIKNNLKKPKINVFKNIKNRIENKFDESILVKKFDGKFFCHDALLPTNHFVKDNSINLIITSPPYLNIVNYTNSNWLKLWLLGFERKDLKNKIKLSDKLNENEYKEFIKKYLNNIYPKIKKGGKVCLVVGDVLGINLIENVWNSIKDEVKFKFKKIYIDNKYSQNKKITNMLNQKKGKATLIEKVLVLEK